MVQEQLGVSGKNGPIIDYTYEGNKVTKDYKGKLLAIIVNDIVIYNMLIYKNISNGIFELGTVYEKKVDYIIKQLNIENQYCGSSKTR